MNRATDLMEPMLTPMQMAELLGIKRKHLYKLVERGQAPPSLRVGRSLRFVPRDYREWLERRKG